MLTRRSFTRALAGAPALACVGASALPGDPFPLRRGTNVSHWLSQSKRRGAERRAQFTRQEAAVLAAMGLDHLRLPVDEEQLFTVDGKPEAEAFDLLNQGLDWCDEFSLRAIVDLHILRSHHFNEKVKPLWTEPAAQERFYQCWRDISKQIGGRSTLKVAYELMNEPVADDPEQWNMLVGRCAGVVRSLEPERRIVIGSNMWQSVDTMDKLKVPPGDPHIILSFHYYHPMVLTHYGAGWTKVGEYKGPVTYPGRLYPDDQLKAQPAELQRAMSPERAVFDRATTVKMLAQPLEVSGRLKLPLYCGEWGCINKAPVEPSLRWYEDTRTVLEENGIGWATWAMKGSFEMIRNAKPIPGLARALGLRA